MTKYQAVFKTAKDGSPVIILSCGDGGMLIPGFRLYQGKIQAPARKTRGNWYPMLYCAQEDAEAIYRAITEAAPDGTYILPVEQAIRGLVYTDGVVSALSGEEVVPR